MATYKRPVPQSFSVTVVQQQTIILVPTFDISNLMILLFCVTRVTLNGSNQEKIEEEPHVFKVICLVVVQSSFPLFLISTFRT